MVGWCRCQGDHALGGTRRTAACFVLFEASTHGKPGIWHTGLSLWWLPFCDAFQGGRCPCTSNWSSLVEGTTLPECTMRNCFEILF